MKTSEEELNRRYLNLSELKKIEFHRHYKEAISLTQKVFYLKKIIETNKDKLEQSKKEYKRDIKVFIFWLILLAVIDFINPTLFSNYVYFFIIGIFFVKACILNLLVIPNLERMNIRDHHRLEENSNNFHIQINIDEITTLSFGLEAVITDEQKLTLYQLILKKVEEIDYDILI